jgi:nucleoside-diphosphate-sugar epimerase
MATPATDHRAAARFYFRSRLIGASCLRNDCTHVRFPPGAGRLALAVITVLGGTGFVGSHLVRRLRETGVAHRAPARGEPLGLDSLGAVVYCIGLTADFRGRPLATVDAHVSQLTEILRHADFERVVYLSSTRVYRRSRGPCSESDVLHLDPGDPDDLYGLSKALGESVVLSRPGGTVVRLSNVYGPNVNPHTFLSGL